MRRSVADVMEDAEFLDSTGVGAIDAANRLDFPTPHALEKWLERHGRADLWQRMKARDPQGWHHQVRRGAVAVQAVDTIAALIEQGRKSDRARFRNKADRIASLVNELREALAADAEEAKQREQARKEVERLERQLAEAKARLRGGSASSARTTTGPSAAEIREWAAENGVECPARGRIPQAVTKAFEAAQENAA